MKTIKLMPDYQCYPLWDMSFDGYGDIDPATLPISKELQDRLLRWSDAYDATLDQIYPPDSGFKNQEEVDAFDAEGVYLEHQLRKELGTNFCIITSNLSASIRNI